MPVLAFKLKMGESFRVTGPAEVTYTKYEGTSACVKVEGPESTAITREAHLPPRNPDNSIADGR